MSRQAIAVDQRGAYPGPFATFLIVFSVFFFVYSVEFSFLPIQTSRILSAMGGLLLLLVAMRAAFRIPVDRSVLLVAALLGGFVVWTGFRITMAGAEDLSLLVASALIFIQVAPGATAIAYVLWRLDFEFDDLVRLLYLIVVLQAFFIVLSFFSWDFKQWTLAYIPVRADVDALHPFRVRGLTHGAGAKLSAFQGAGLLMATYLLIRCRSYREFLFLLVTSVLVAGSILFTGRTGVLAIPIAVAVLGAYTVFTGRVGKKSAMAVLALPAALVVGFLLLQQTYALLGGWDSTTAGSDALQGLVEFFLDEFVTYLREDPLQGGTVGVLLKYHWFFPETDWELFIGDPNTWAVNRIHSDVGLVRMLFGAGLIGTVLLYAGVLAMFASMLGRVRSVDQKALIVALASWMTIVELKEPYFLDLRNLSVVVILFMFLCFRKSERRA